LFFQLILRIENGCIAVEIYLQKIIKSKIKQRRFNFLFNNAPFILTIIIIVHIILKVYYRVTFT
jgi:hypothetical protein